MKDFFHKWFLPHPGNDHKPHFLRAENVSVLLGVAFLVEVLFVSHLFVLFGRPDFLASILPAVLVDLTNSERSLNQAEPLLPNPLLEQAAKLKATDMATRGYFSHNTPEGKEPWYWLDKVGYEYLSAGENLAVDFVDSADVQTAWMNSPTHRANVVKKDYVEVGIAMAEGFYQGHPTVFVVQFFGTPRPVIQTPVVVQVQPVSRQTPPSPVQVTDDSNPSVLGAEKDETDEVIVSSVIENQSPVEELSLPQKTQSIESEDSAAITKKALVSPRLLNAALLKVLLFLSLFALAALAVRYSHSHHKALLMNGAVLASALVALILFNSFILPSTVTLPSDNQSASLYESVE